MRDRILSYLASGIKPVQVATIVGCSPGYISQLVATEDFQAELNALVLSKPAEAEETDLDNKYVSLEHAILKSIDSAIVGAELPALTRALEVVAKRQDMRFARKHPSLQHVNPLGGTNIAFITVALPAHAVPHPVIELNSQKEILSINQKSLAPMNSESVRELFTKMATDKQAAIANVIVEEAAMRDF